MKVHDKARELVEVLKEEEVYQEFVHWQQQVFFAPKPKETLLALRRQEFALHARQLQGGVLSEEEKADLQEAYRQACTQDVLRQYLEAEHRFSKVMLEIQKIINGAVPISSRDFSS